MSSSATEQCVTSPMQERLWLLEQLDPGSSVYNVPLAFELTGPLRPPSLRVALVALARRHETLRTAFTYSEDTDEPVQVIAATPTVRLAVTDATQLPRDEQQRRRDALIANELATPFDLEESPLWRAHLIKLSAENHVLMLTLHHIVTDGWSNEILHRDLAALYHAEVCGDVAALPELAIQYADYAQWMRERLAEAQLEVDLRYWRGKLTGAPTALRLPTDRARPTTPSAARTHLAIVDPALTSGLDRVSREHGCTIFMTLAAAFATALADWTHQDDFLLAFLLAGRHRPELEDLIGFFVNTVVLRCDLFDQPAFPTLLSRIRGSLLEAYEHQDTPFQHVVRAVAPQRAASTAIPLAQINLILQDVPQRTDDFGDVACRRLTVRQHAARFDLTLSIEPQDGGFELEYIYNVDLFDHPTIERLAGRFAARLADVTRVRTEGPAGA